MSKKIFKKTFEISPNLTIQIERIQPEIVFNEYKSYKLIPIQNSAYYLALNSFHREYQVLPQLYAALTYLSGPSDSCYDDYKGSFNFTFILKVIKNNFLR